MAVWYREENLNENIVVSTRIRLARNLEGLPFPSKMTTEQREELNKKLKKAVEESVFSKTLKFIDMSDIPETQVFAMMERHIISPEFATSKQKRSIILSPDESISIMIGEEDHIRIQVILGGLQIDKAYEIACEIDKLLFNNLSIAFNKDFGYLTECPTNLGTGLRASLMLHLPVLESNGKIPQLAESINKIGFTIRGLYGEGTKSGASLYQLSNQITLGITEKEALENLKAIAGQLFQKEKEEWSRLDQIKIEDICFRALGTLQNCRLLSSNEMMNLLSKIKLGMNMGIININKNPIALLIEGGPYMLMKKYGQMEMEERDIYRANFVRKELAQQ